MKIESILIRFMPMSMALIFMFFSMISAVEASSFYGENPTNTIMVSPIGSQQVIAGGGIDIYFTAFDPVVAAGASFSSDDLPSFAEIIDNQDNSGRIAVNTSAGDAGEYLFHLQVTGSAGTTSVPVLLNVIEIDSDATVYYCDPENGSMDNVGDFDNPWGSLQALFATSPNFEDGDVILLRNGYHGRPEIVGQNDGSVYIAAQANHTPKVRNLKMVFARNWVISGLEISPESAGIMEKGNYLKLVANAKYNTIENCHIYAIKNSTVWTENQDWYDYCGDGVSNIGEYNTIRNNLITNTYFSVTIDGEHNHFDYNIINIFGGDAIRGLESYNSFNYNVIMNAVVADYDTGNHDDVFQSWTFGAPIKSIEIIGNIAFSCTDPDLPLKTNILQGIVIFDGFAEDWVIANNLVVQDHPHGIAIYGAKNCKVVNNTVIKNPLELFSNGSDPWVRINKHKDGSFSTGNLVRNNISGAFIMDSVPGSDDHNTVSTSYTDYLVDYDNWDFHLKENAAEIDAGYIDDSPQMDIERYVRLPSSVPDRGCFEKEATIFDITPPNTPTNLEVLDVEPSSVIVTWDEASDNTGISHYKVHYDGKTVKTVDGAAHIYNLSAATDYEFEVEAVDYSNNNSPVASISTTTMDYPAGEFYTLKIPVSRDDHQIRSINKLEWVGHYEHNIGGVSNTYDASAVLPFRLPALDDLEEIVKAELKLNLKEIHNNPSHGIDVYGLAYRTGNDVLATDNWQGSFGSDAASTALVQNYISSSSTQGVLPMSTAEVTVIADYINNEYDGGASVGKHIFLRLNSNVEDEDNNAYFTVSSGNEPQSKDRPYLELTIKKGPVATHDVQKASNLAVYPNPISNNQTLKVTVPNDMKGKGMLLIHDITGRLVYKKNIENMTTVFDVDMKMVNLISGAYQLSLKGEKNICQTKLIIN